MSKGWTEERRRAQAERCRQNKPWQHSTGPKTPAGKARSSMNAFKHGGDTALKNLARKMLKHNEAFIDLALQVGQIELIKSQQKQRRMGEQTEQTIKNELKEKE